MLISNINIRSDIISFAFVQFVGKYLYIYQPKLAYNEIETQE